MGNCELVELSITDMASAFDKKGTDKAIGTTGQGIDRFFRIRLVMDKEIRLSCLAVIPGLANFAQHKTYMFCVKEPGAVEKFGDGSTVSVIIWDVPAVKGLISICVLLEAFPI